MGARKASVGRSEEASRASWSIPASTRGSSENSASASNTSAVSSLNCSVLGSTSAPASKASASTGAEVGSVARRGAAPGTGRSGCG